MIRQCYGTCLCVHGRVVGAYILHAHMPNIRGKIRCASHISDRNSRTHKACTERCPLCEGPRYGLTARAVLEVGLLSIVCDPRLCALVVNVVIERSLSLITWKCLNVLYCKVLC